MPSIVASPREVPPRPCGMLGPSGAVVTSLNLSSPPIDDGPGPACARDGAERAATSPTSEDPPRPATALGAARWFHHLSRHETLLWWLHSAWALAFGVAAMWLGTRHPGLLRLAFAQIAFIWLASLAAPWIARHPRLGRRWQRLATLALNYFNKNFYQQLLFFVLPVYAASTTAGSVNMLFVGLVALSAVLSTFDVVYDRQVARRRVLRAPFFAFALFACVNVTLPLVWQVSNARALRVAGALALVGFVTLWLPPRDWYRGAMWRAVAVAALVVAFFVEFGRPLVPPAPLRLTRSEVGTGFDAASRRVVQPVGEVPRGQPRRLHVQTNIHAPLGLRDRVRHRWRIGGHEFYRSPYYLVRGGRRDGFRLWTHATVPAAQPGERLRVDVETEAGQLIGRVERPVM